MIGSDKDALIDQPLPEASSNRLGGPLVSLALVLMVWIGGRSVLWEDPFASEGLIGQAVERFAQPSDKPTLPQDGKTLVASGPSVSGERVAVSADLAPALLVRLDAGPAPALKRTSALTARAHNVLWHSALASDLRRTSWRARGARYMAQPETHTDPPVFPGSAPRVLRKTSAKRVSSDRWSLAAWTFAREGSNTRRVSPGPAPVYGASQAGAILQYRAAPSNSRDPRAYARVSRSLVDQPETEVALGVSARPLTPLALRVAAEARLTDNALGRDVRPSVYAITEVPPVSLPLDLAAEVYAAGGYVGGQADTAFIDGQAVLAGEVTNFDLRRADDVRVSLGAGAWGGAQRGVHRLDVGPTVRFDVAVGTVPARLSIDYRERIGGEATPSSGLAATLSTQF